MKRREIISLCGIMALALALLLGKAVAQQSDSDKIKATIDAFHAALSSLDIRKMDDVWAHDPYVMAINPRDKSVSIGWDNVRKSYEATVAFWAELKVTQKDGPHIHVNGNVAWANGIAVAGGKPKTGDAVAGAPTFESDVFEKRGDRWVLVSHSAWRVPQ